MKPEKNEQGKFPAFAWPGGYSIVYYTADCALLCAKCANGENGSEAELEHEEKQWRLEHSDVRWEGPTEQCEHCNADMPTEYGDPGEETSANVSD